MIGTTRFEYIYIRFFITALHHVAPLCLIYCTFMILFYGPKKLIRSPFAFYSFAESLLFFAYFPYRRYLQRDAVNLPATDRNKRRELVSLCHQNIPDPVSYLRMWFLGADLADIKRENLKEFMLWAFFNRGGSPDDDAEELNEYVDDFEKLLGYRIEEGRGSAVPLRLTLDKVDMLHRSLLWYFCIGFVDSLTHIIMYCHGFKFYRTGYDQIFTTFPFRPLALVSTYKSPVKNLAYWYRKHKSKDFLPVVFFHGIGVGLYPYTSFLKEINENGKFNSFTPDEQVGIIAIENLHISLRLTQAPCNNEQTCYQIEKILLNHFPRSQEFVFVAHSFGTSIVSLLLKNPSTAKYINSIVLIDPIPILLHLPDIAYNFTRKIPLEANEYQLFYFARMDIGVAHTLARHFFWSDVILWKETFGDRRITVSLSGRDIIVNSEAVGRYLNTDYIIESTNEQSYNGDAVSAGNKYLSTTIISVDSIGTQKCKVQEEIRLITRSDEWKYRLWRGIGIDILWYENLGHAQIFDRFKTRHDLVSVIRKYCENRRSSR